MHLLRSSLLLALLLCLVVGSGVAQKKKIDPDAGYIPIVAPESKNKDKNSDVTQALALPPELPAAVTAETGRLTFHVTPLSAKGLLSRQTEDALKALLHSKRGTIVALRAFVAGSGDLRRIGEIAAEMFQEKHLDLPALTAVQVGALPLEQAQVVIESTEVDRKVVNPAGVAFIAAQPGSSVPESLGKIKTALASAGMQPSDALLLTCFVSSLDNQRNAVQAISADFPNAAVDYVQMQRAPAMPAAECEARARLRTAVPSGFQAGPHSALVSSPEIVITGTQMAFGSQDSDLKLAFERLEKTLAAKNAHLNHVASAHLYVTSSALSSRVLALLSDQSGSSHPATVVPIEALPSLDAPFGLEVIAVPGSNGAHP